jgi:hypothetical protein
MNSNSLVLAFWALLVSNLFAQTWPLSNRLANFDQINSIFAELRSSGARFHFGVDLRNQGGGGGVLSFQAGRIAQIINAGQWDETLVIEHESPPGSGMYPRRTRYTHVVSNVAVMQRVNEGEQIGTVRTQAQLVGAPLGVHPHLHFEMHIEIDGQWYALNPLRNDQGWNLPFPPAGSTTSDIHDPVIHNIYLEPIPHMPPDVISGYDIRDNSGSMAEFEGAAQIHIDNHPFNFDDDLTPYDIVMDTLIVYGSIGPIVNARDAGINGGDTGAGLTVYSITALIDGIKKYDIEFDRIGTDDQLQTDQVFHIPFNTATDTDPDDGNNDFLELRSLDAVYLFPHKLIDLGIPPTIQSNGIWFTKAHKNTLPAFSNTPADFALISDDALYRDGIHFLSFEVEDAAERNVSETINVFVDNFRPYVKKVTIKNNAQTLYEAEWTLTTDVLLYGPQPTPNGNIHRAASPGQDVDIIIEFSEPMKLAQISGIEPSLDALPTLSSDQPALSRTIWKGKVSKDLLFSKQLQTGQLILSIHGRDLANNRILKVTDTTPIDPVTQLSRAPKDPSKFQGEDGLDKLHRFNIAQDVTFLVDVTASMRNDMPGVKADLLRLVNQFDDSGIKTEYNLFWFFDANSSFFFPKAVNVQDKNSIRDAIITTNALSGTDPSCRAQSVRACAILLPQHMPHGGTAYVFTDSPPAEGANALKITIREMRKLGIKIQSLLPAPEDCGTTVPLAYRHRNQDNSVLRDDVPTLSSNSSELLSKSRQVDSDTLTVYEAFSRLSGETGGQFFLVDTPDIPAAFDVLIADELLDSQLLVREISGAQAYSVPIDTSVREVSFLLKEKPDAKVNLVVRRPDGALLAVSDPDVSFSSGSNFEFYRVSDPAEGNWSSAIAGSGDFSFEVDGDTPIALSLLSTPDWVAGEQQFIQVELSGKQNIASASFNLVTLDGSAATPLSLFDDGQHNDFGAGDGIYGGAFTPATEDTFRIQATGITASGENFVREDRIPIIIGADPNTSVDFEAPSPTTFALHQNYPNPFNPETKFGFDIPDLREGKSTVRLAIYNISGQLVRLLVDESRAPGRHEILWDGRDAFGKAVSAGVYFYQMTAGEFKAVNKMLVLK